MPARSLRTVDTADLGRARLAYLWAPAGDHHPRRLEILAGDFDHVVTAADWWPGPIDGFDADDDDAPVALSRTLLRCWGFALEEIPPPSGQVLHAWSLQRGDT